ncbi:MAG TPA: NUMOD3 domain-containing DNA-binding protein [Candidatus Paceibacterota bacterium]|nr:NUMOD3 domain-containing DNA-binding protein [Candidatus Paceibacterota bacterium]
MEKRCGVYAIRNCKNGRLYIGSASNVGSRWRAHKRGLERGKHPNIILQRAWRKHGSKAFKCVLLEECPRNALLEREQLWLNAALAGGKPYNLARSTSSPMLGRKHTRAARRKISHFLREYCKQPDVLLALSERVRGENNPMFGRTHDFKARERIAASRRGKKMALAVVEKMRQKLLGNKNAKGFRHTLELRERMLGNERAVGNKSWTGRRHTEESKAKLAAGIRAAWARRKAARRFDELP